MAGRGTDRTGRKRASAAGRARDASGAESGGAAYDSADVAGILDAVEVDDDAAWAKRVDRYADDRENSLGGLGRRHPVGELWRENKGSFGRQDWCESRNSCKPGEALFGDVELEDLDPRFGQLDDQLGAVDDRQALFLAAADAAQAGAARAVLREVRKGEALSHGVRVPAGGPPRVPKAFIIISSLTSIARGRGQAGLGPVLVGEVLVAVRLLSRCRIETDCQCRLRRPCDDGTVEDDNNQK